MPRFIDSFASIILGSECSDNHPSYDKCFLAYSNFLNELDFPITSDEYNKLSSVFSKLDEFSVSLTVRTNLAIYYIKCLRGYTGVFDGNKISYLTKKDTLSYSEINSIFNDLTCDKALLSKTAILKLNGGLGTSMECQGLNLVCLFSRMKHFWILLVNNFHILETSMMLSYLCFY